MSSRPTPAFRRRGPEADHDELLRLLERLAGLFPELTRPELERAVRGDYGAEIAGWDATVGLASHPARIHADQGR